MARMPRKSSHRIVALILIGSALLADAVLVIGPAQRHAEPFTTRSSTILGGYHAGIGRPDVQIAPEAIPPRLLYGDEASQARSRGEEIWSVSLTWPFPQQRGLLTPFYRTCAFRFEGWDEETDLLRSEFAARVNADPSLSHLPAWCRAAMTNESGRATRIVWWLLAHDVLFSMGLLAFVGLGFVEASRGVQRMLVRRRPGRCDNCGYDLAGLRGATCPECGRRDETAAAP